MKQLILSPGQRQGDHFLIAGKDFHYLAHVRRLIKGDLLSGICGTDQFKLEVTSVSAETIQLKILDQQLLDQAPANITLFAFLLKARKLDDVIRQVCEAGVSSFVPVQGDHCVSQVEQSGDQAKKLDRWKSIAKEAAQQSGTQGVCEIHPVIRSNEICTSWERQGPLFFFHQLPLAKTSLHRYLFPKPRHIGLIIGPEGGLSEKETQLFEHHGAWPIWLGPRVLRAETASLYAAAAVQTILQENTEWTIPT